MMPRFYSLLMISISLTMLVFSCASQRLAPIEDTSSSAPAAQLLVEDFTVIKIEMNLKPMRIIRGFSINANYSNMLRPDIEVVSTNTAYRNVFLYYSFRVHKHGYHDAGMLASDLLLIDSTGSQNKGFYRWYLSDTENAWAPVSESDAIELSPGYHNSVRMFQVAVDALETTQLQLFGQPAGTLLDLQRQSPIEISHQP